MSFSSSPMLAWKNYFLIDPDRVDLSNLNRFVIGAECDIGRLKVDVAADYIRGFNQVPTSQSFPLLSCLRRRSPPYRERPLFLVAWTAMGRVW